MELYEMGLKERGCHKRGEEKWGKGREQMVFNKRDAKLEKRDVVVA